MFRQSLRKIQQLKHAAETLPKVSWTALRHGALPIGYETFRTIQKEGFQDLHWKASGDVLMRFFRTSGPVFTKIGQILSTRNDLLPEAICQRLEALYNEQPAMPAKELRKLLSNELKESPFVQFDETPIGVGSVGQVHRAKLKDGTPVIVKIIRPGSDRKIRKDMNALLTYLALIYGISFRRKSPTYLLLKKSMEHLAESFQRETDLENEAKALEEFQMRFKRNPRVTFPKCYRALSTRRILVMEELKGTPLNEYRSALNSGNPLEGETARRLADTLLQELLKQIFEEGIFHADPHPGNILVLNDGRIGFIDLGLTGEFGSKERKKIARAIKAFVARDANGVISALLGFGEVGPGFDQEKFKNDVVEIIKGHKAGVSSRLSGSDSEGNSIEAFVNALFRVAYRHRIYVPPSATLLIKTLVTIEGVSRSLNPELNLMKVAFPVLLSSLLPKWVRWLKG